MHAQHPASIVFMGTPPFAATVLQKLMDWDGGSVRGVYCQPDRPAGRGKKLVSSAVKLLAQEAGVAVMQPQNFREAATVATLQALEPDFLVVAAYGCILPQCVLDIPRIAPINVHASLLPQYRGAAPIQRAIMDGQTQTGVSIMHMEAGLDTGAVYTTGTIAIGEHTAGSLHDALAALGAARLLAVLADFSAFVPKPQDNTLATYAAKLRKEEGVIDWSMPATTVHAHIRGLTPWPGGRTVIVTPHKGEVPLLLMPGEVGGDKPATVACGDVLRLASGEIAVACADKFYFLRDVRPINRGSMSIYDFANGYLVPDVGRCAQCLSRGG